MDVNDAFAMPESVLVLGAGSDIARATLRQLVLRGARTVVLAGRDSASSQEAATEAASLGAADVVTLAFDATAVDNHSRFAEDAFTRAGEIDLVLAAAGVLGSQDSDERDPQAAASVMATNFTGLASALLAIAGHMRAQGHGHIVVLSSVAAERARKANFIYGASKAGLDAFAQGLGDSMLDSEVKVLVVRPGFVRTKMTSHMSPAPLAVTADDVASAILRGIETGKEIIWVPPAMRPIMVALRHLPRSVFRRIPI